MLCACACALCAWLQRWVCLHAHNDVVCATPTTMVCLVCHLPGDIGAAASNQMPVMCICVCVCVSVVVVVVVVVAIVV